VIFRSINHPVGHTVQGLFNWWFRQNLRDDQGLAAELKGTLTEITNSDVEIYRYGRVLLGANVVALFRVDRQWTERHVLPLFDWRTSREEAATVWKGFLWTPRLYRPLLEQIKAPFLATAGHYEELGDHGEQYAGLLTYAVLEAPDLFTVPQQRAAFAMLPSKGLRRSALTVVDALQGAGEQRSEYWVNRVKPFIGHIWPQGEDRRSPSISEAFARMLIASGDAFPEAFESVRGWLLPSDQPGLVPHELAESKQGTKFPEIALALLDAIISDDLRWPPSKFKACLDEIKTAQPELRNDHRYLRLDGLVRRVGAG
jgi:hypothetical protein